MTVHFEYVHASMYTYSDVWHYKYIYIYMYIKYYHKQQRIV